MHKGRRIQGALGDENRRIEGERRRAVAKKGVEEWISPLVKRKVQLGPKPGARGAP